ncbi:protein ECT2-like isoform X1 [Scleropages formosus]|uniref:protein ECT2-like isoform X1 n=1 Tax=Scleropages formosus TaxID=113540 RepID=UPI0010FA79E4|nr:protein ECT2-like isoform X1 [Scleropages formosus]XP_029105217.1 protein ECT2-like isoform X1 [Scleropages formosus]
MDDCGTVTLGAAQSLLVDSSVIESRATESFQENLLSEDPDYVLPRVARIVLVGEAGNDEKLVKALEPRFLQNVRVMEVPAVKINAGGRDGEVGKRLVKSIVNMDIAVPHSKAANVQEVGDRENAEFETVFALTDFEGPDFEYLYKNDHRIVGPPALLHCAGTQEPLPFSSRPLYSTTMMNLSLCFTGFRDKEEVVHLVSLVHHMGGTIRKDFSSKVTHLIARSTHGEKYRLAVCMGTPILTPDWIRAAWERRDEVGFGAGDEEFRADFKVPPFQDCVLSFLGFSDEERNNMQERTLKHGGHYLEVQAERCTHVVVEENEVEELPFLPSKRLYVVKQEWFWGSIQMDARAGESMYLYEKPAVPPMTKAVSLLSLSVPSRRRQVRDTLAQLAKETEISPFPPHRPHSVDLSSSTDAPLDIADAPESSKAPGAIPQVTVVQPKPSARWQVSKELYQTESNYVDILTTVLQLFKHPLEKEGLVGGPILAQEEIKTIFGSIPDIYDVHSRIKTDLEELVMNWAEDKSVGDIILRYSKDLMKAYPQFVNFLEMSKDTIVRCEKQKPRFHAFLKINQAKPECGRQTLVDLLIRPVQRLPSVALLLNDIRKLTSEDNPDKVTLGKAIESLKEVMTHINEDKRKTEGQKQIFDVVYEVDGCPANLLSSHRTLVHRAETVTLGEKPCDRGENVTLFLFNDCLEIARKRHKVMGPLRSPLGPLRPPASLKHVALMPLSQIRRVLDLQETDDCRNAFALVVRLPTEQDNQLFSFQLSGEDTDKAAWLRMLCRHVADTICKADAEDLIRFAEPESIQVSTKDVDSTLSRASRAIKKTSKKVTRAFSFTKTPKRVIQRAIMASSSQHDADHMVHFTGTVALNGVHSPSLVDLPSSFERKCMAFSRSTSHLL